MSSSRLSKSQGCNRGMEISRNLPGKEMSSESVHHYLWGGSPFILILSYLGSWISSFRCPLLWEDWRHSLCLHFILYSCTLLHHVLQASPVPFDLAGVASSNSCCCLWHAQLWPYSSPCSVACPSWELPCPAPRGTEAKPDWYTMICVLWCHPAIHLC